MGTTITRKGQLIRPKKIGDLFNLLPEYKVKFVIDEKGSVRMMPVKSTLIELKGMVPKPEKAVSLDEILHRGKFYGQYTRLHQSVRRMRQCVGSEASLRLQKKIIVAMPIQNFQ